MTWTIMMRDPRLPSYGRHADAMSARDRHLYHQVHPGKIAVDVLSGMVA